MKTATQRRRCWTAPRPISEALAMAAREAREEAERAALHRHLSGQGDPKDPQSARLVQITRWDACPWCNRVHTMGIGRAVCRGIAPYADSFTAFFNQLTTQKTR